MTITRETYRQWVIGTLVYTVVLSLFSDYTDLLQISSASTVLLASFVLQALTFWTIGFKKWLGGQFKYPSGQRFKPAKLFSLWFVLFSSKFVFLWVIDALFGADVEFAGFVSLMIVIVVMTIIKEALFYLDDVFPSSNHKER